MITNLEVAFQIAGYKYQKEYKFSERKFRFDYALPDYKIAIEIEGGVWIRGRHNRALGYKRDLEKYNLATTMGWRILRYTPDTPILHITRDIETILSNQTSEVKNG